MTLTINGQKHRFGSAEMTLPELLEQLDLAGKPVVVERNREPVLPQAHESTMVADGDELEIVTIAAGG